MNKDKMAMAIPIFLVCCLLVSVMCAQFKTVEQTDIIGIETAREEELRTMIADWKSKCEETEEQIQETISKINEYKETETSSEATQSLLDEELRQTNMLVGKTDVVGDGVIITLQNNDDAEIEYTDLLILMNELKLAGAQAISINDIRIVNMTEIVEVNGIILINEQRVSAPYTVKAIGDQTYLSSALSLKNSGYIDKYTNLGKTVNMSIEKNIKILAYNSNNNLMEFKYSKEVK